MKHETELRRLLELTANPEALGALDGAEAEKAFSDANFYYAMSENPQWVLAVFPIYRQWMAVSEPSVRLRHLQDFSLFLEDHHGQGYLGLMAFIEAEEDHQVISTASLNIASVAPPAEGSPYAGASFVAEHLLRKRALEETDGSVLAGLILVGDRRVMEQAKTIWQRLPSAGRDRVAKSRSGVLWRAHLEFLLWALADETDAGVFGTLAASLFNFPRLGNEVFEIERHLPVWDCPDPEGPIRVLARQTFRELGDELRSEFEALIADEPGEEKVLPVAFSLWLGDEGQPTGLDAPARARRYAEGRTAVDWKGENHTDTAGYWHADDPLGEVALLVQLGKQTSGLGGTFPRAFPFYRESIELRLPGADVEAWLGLALLAGFRFAAPTDALDLTDQTTRETFAEAAPYAEALESFLKGGEPGLRHLVAFYRWLHDSLDIEIGKGVTTEKLYRLADRSLWLGAAMTAREADAAKAWLKQAARPATLWLSHLVESLVEATAAETTSELMIPVLLKLCQSKYAAHTAEIECFGAFYQEALRVGGLCPTDSPERWVADAHAFARALAEADRERSLEILLTLSPERIREARAICEEMADGRSVMTVEAALAATRNYVEEELGYRHAPRDFVWNLDRIIHGVDLVVWAVLLEAYPEAESVAVEKYGERPNAT